jgi:hypothetical protein
MAISMINPESWLPSRGPDEAEPAKLERPDAGPAATALLSRPSRARSGEALLAGSTSDTPAPFYKPMPTAATFALRPEDFTPALRGYAPASGARQTTALLASAASATAKTGGSQKASATKTKTTTKSSSAKQSTSRELAFLDDKKLSIEDKLFQFMALMTKKSDQELVDAMKEYETKKAAQKEPSSTSEKPSSSKSSSSSEAKPLLNPDGGGGLFGFLGDALGGIGKAIVGGAESLAKDLGGPVLAGVATAAGMPFLAPAALKLGGDLSAGLIEGVASTVGLGKSSGSTAGSTAAKSGSSSAAKATTSSSKKSSAATMTSGEEFDEKLAMFELQRLVEKQNAMFAALSNAMKSMHESQMTAVQNIR